MFGRQPDARLSGQRRFEHPARVREVLEAMLCARHRVLVFLDDSYQRDGASPSYPEGCEETQRFLTHVVRLPAAARDVAMPFCRERVAVASSDGQVDFYPLLDERTHGEFVPVDVPYRGALNDSRGVAMRVERREARLAGA